MRIEQRKVSYSWDSVMEAAGLKGYSLYCFVWRDGESVLDEHRAFYTKEELYEAMEAVLPILEEAGPGPEPTRLSLATSA